MNPFQSKRILVGVSGSIAAYKSCQLIRLLVKAGAEVKVLMTDSASGFITPLTLATLSRNPVLSEFTGDSRTGVWNNHVDLALWADALVIAPATAHTIARCANGLCNDLLLAVYLSMRSDVFFAPAMDLDMLQHPATLENLSKLRSYGHHLIEPGYGELASGLVGSGRMAEPEEIFRALAAHFSRRPEALGKKVLITAGPTQEDLDPVRFISNHSSGKMGYALAEAFSDAGCEVSLISGPVRIEPPKVSELVRVRSAREMYEAAESRYRDCHLVIFAAAVADYAPVNRSREKIKKQGESLTLELKKTVDIAADLGQKKSGDQLMMGFALETTNEMENAWSKLQKKNLDFIVLNSLNDPGAGFELETNKVFVIDTEKITRSYEVKPKKEVAADLLEIILDKWKKN